MEKFKVKRPHVGDREYAIGDVREANSRDVAHLIPNTLEPIVVESKAEPHPQNKMDSVPLNKGRRGK